MSKGPGRIEAAIIELLKNTKDRALSISDITRHAFGLNGAEPTRIQRLSATRAAHRLIGRAAKVEAKIVDAFHRAMEDARRDLGREPGAPGRGEMRHFMMG